MKRAAPVIAAAAMQVISIGHAQARDDWEDYGWYAPRHDRHHGKHHDWHSGPHFGRHGGAHFDPWYG
jgi:Ni/Co efflux regulator RcnB